MTYVPKSQRRGSTIVLYKADKYRIMLQSFIDIEATFKEVDEISVLGASYFPRLISYEVCIAKELLKYAIRALKTGDLTWLDYLPENQHIHEEIDGLIKALKNLKEDLAEAKTRKEI